MKMSTKEKHDLLRQLGEKVADLRIAKDWNQRALAKKINRSAAHVSLIEAGRSWLSFETWMTISSLFDIHPSELLSSLRLKKTRK